MKTFSSQLSSVEIEVVFRESLSALPVQDISGFDPAEELTHFLVFADEEFNIGEAWYCMDSVSGSVYRVSPEFGTGPEYVNSSMEGFRASIEAAAKWSTDHDSKAVRTNPNVVDLLADALTTIDDKALESADHYWAVIIDHIRQCAPLDDEESEFRFAIA